MTTEQEHFVDMLCVDLHITIEHLWEWKYKIAEDWIYNRDDMHMHYKSSKTIYVTDRNVLIPGGTYFICEWHLRERNTLNEFTLRLVE